MSDKVYFVSGGSRGIGFELVTQLSARPGIKVITTATNPDKSADLQNLAKERGNIHILKYEATSEADAIAVGEQVGKLVDGIDVFIANAAIGGASGTLVKVSAKLLRDLYEVNVVGTILLTQSLYPHLLKKKTRTILYVSSIAGSMGQFLPLTVPGYGQSKAAINYTVKELSFELSSENFIVTAIHPGGVATDMAKKFLSDIQQRNPELYEKIKDGSIAPAESASKVLEVLDSLKAEDNGTFRNYTGETIPW
ncbi:hypothetical protein AWJ20_517 [Sugiyamaella lignohabitans]|uniref:Uncharacterized protein n=1 Tax=Sugiyamaella lignohabitans TaxID=796027 RepID=A0A161HKK5_9ASCO|nr:uncharacterized protein AWJ20_517 [Sugiyamaella lignohabitans]ANB12268.1 hypothetical protein AWJ20_517 [Sugiyamaella lignohabitans]